MPITIPTGQVCLKPTFEEWTGGGIMGGTLSELSDYVIPDICQDIPLFSESVPSIKTLVYKGASDESWNSKSIYNFSSTNEDGCLYDPSSDGSLMPEVEIPSDICLITIGASGNPTDGIQIPTTGISYYAGRTSMESSPVDVYMRNLTACVSFSILTSNSVAESKRRVEYVAISGLKSYNKATISEEGEYIEIHDSNGDISSDFAYRNTDSTKRSFEFILPVTESGDPDINVYFKLSGISKPLKYTISASGDTPFILSRCYRYALNLTVPDYLFVDPGIYTYGKSITPRVSGQDVSRVFRNNKLIFANIPVVRIKAAYSADDVASQIELMVADTTSDYILSVEGSDVNVYTYVDSYLGSHGTDKCHLRISSSVAIPGDLFYEKLAIYSVYIENADSIGSYCFGSCSNIKQVVIGPSVKEIKESVFSFCGSIEKVIIGNDVTKIGSSSFTFCDNLKKLVIGTSVVEIGESAFGSSSNLEDISFYGTSEPNVGEGSFYNVFTDVKVLKDYTGTKFGSLNVQKVL